MWIYLFYLFLAALGLCCGAQASHCGGFSCCGARTLGMKVSVVVAHRLSSCGSRAPECRLSSCGTRAHLLCGMWESPRPGLELVSPTLAGGFLTTAPPEKPSKCEFKLCISYFTNEMNVLFSLNGRRVNIIKLHLSKTSVSKPSNLWPFDPLMWNVLKKTPVTSLPAGTLRHRINPRWNTYDK